MPSDGGVRAIRELLVVLDERSIDLSVHTSDLDDVFLTLTGQHNQHKESTR